MLALGVVAAIAPTGDPDVWWHLKTGELALSSPGLLAHDPFSFTSGGAPWRYKDLVADVLLYRGFAAIGFAWFVVLKVLVTAVQALAIWLVQPRGRRSRLVVLAGTAALLVGVRLVERPNLFSVAMFPLVLALLERARRVLHRGGRALALRLLLLVVVGWAWLCLHRAGVLSIALVAGLFVWTLVAALLPAHPLLGERPPRAAVLATGLAALASASLAFLNPSGAAALTSSVGVAGAALLRATISEWQRLPPLALARAFPVPLAFAGCACAISIARARAITLLPTLLVVAGGVAALDSVRWVPYLAATSVLVCALGLAAPVAALHARAALRPLPALVAVAAFAATWSARVSPWAVGADAARTAEHALGVLAANHVGGKLGNALEHGGYLIWRAWPERKVLVDGRNETVYPPELLARLIASERDPAVFAALRDEHGLDLVIAGNGPGRQTHLFLAADPAWAMVDWSDGAILWARIADHPELAAARFTRLDPRSLDGSVVRMLARGAATPAEAAALRAELERLVLASPDSVRALGALAVFHHLRGDAAARDRVMDRLDALAPDHPAVRELARRFGR